MNRQPRMQLLLSSAIFAGVCLAVLAVPAASSAAPPSVELQLSLDEPSILPGTPTGLTVTMTNHAGTPLKVPSSLWLVARNEAGETFVIRASTLVRGESAARVLTDSERSVPANGDSELRFDAVNVVAGSPWFMDTRLWTPGRYRLRAVLAESVNDAGSFDASLALVSNEQDLRVELPSAEDATVWGWMQEQKWNEGAWLMRPWQLLKFVSEHHPKSRYALFTAAYLPITDDRPSPRFDELMRQYSDSPFTEQLKLFRIFWYQQSSDIARRHSDLYRATNDAEAGRDLATTLAHASHSAVVRATASDFLKHIPTREQLREKPVSR